MEQTVDRKVISGPAGEGSVLQEFWSTTGRDKSWLQVRESGKKERIKRPWLRKVLWKRWKLSWLCLNCVLLQNDTGDFTRKTTPRMFSSVAPVAFSGFPELPWTKYTLFYAPSSLWPPLKRWNLTYFPHRLQGPKGEKREANWTSELPCGQQSSEIMRQDPILPWNSMWWREELACSKPDKQETSWIEGDTSTNSKGRRKWQSEALGASLKNEIMKMKGSAWNQ